MEAANAEGKQRHGLLESDTGFKALLESCPCALIAYQGTRITFANPAACELLRAASADLVNRPLLELVHPAWKEAMAALLQDAFNQRTATQPSRALWTTLDGHELDLEVVGARWLDLPEPSGQLYLRPISERRQLEDNLRAAQRQIRTVTDRVHEFAIFTVDPSGRVASWNLGAERVFGHGTDEIVGQPFDVLFTPEDRAQQAPQHELEQATRTGLAQDERWHLRRDGSRIFVSGLLFSVVDEAGAVVAYTKVVQDRTQRRQAQELLEASEARYRELSAELEDRVNLRTQHLEQSVQTWESFCYSIAHDLRAPLRTMSGFAEALLEDYGERLDATGQEYARRMVQAAGRLDEFIQDLLSFGRLAHAELPRFAISLEDAVDRVLAELGVEIEGANALIEVERPMPAVAANPSALSQVLSNLITNALKFVRPGMRPEVSIQASAHDGLVRLDVTDRGIGIAPEHQERVFQLFERLHPSSAYPGTGVGLAIVRKAMERMGGQVGMNSRPGQGTTFWIELPVA